MIAHSTPALTVKVFMCNPPIRKRAIVLRRAYSEIGRLMPGKMGHYRAGLLVNLGQNIDILTTVASGSASLRAHRFFKTPARVQRAVRYSSSRSQKWGMVSSYPFEQNLASQ
jgi:hypothetical protein